MGWYDGNGNKVSGNARTEVKSPYIYTFKMGNKSTQYTAVYAGGSAQKYTGNGGAVTQFSVDVPRKLNGLPFQPEGYTSQPAEDEKVLGPIEFNSLFQAEDSVTMNEGFIEANHLGFTGTGFVNLANNNQSFASYDLDFPEAATTTLAIVYANGGKTDRLINVYLDHDYYVSCPPNGWDTWDTVYTEIMTPKGEGTLQIISMTSDGAPNIDMFGFEMKGVVYKGATRPDTNKVVSGDTTANDTSETEAIVKNLELSVMGNAVVTVFDMQGKLVAKRQMMVGNRITSKEFDEMVKTSGLYHVVVRKGSQVMHQSMAKLK